MKALHLPFVLFALMMVMPVVALANPETTVTTKMDANLAHMQKQERMLDGFSAEGTMVTAWRSHGALARIEVVGLGEYGRVLFDFWWRGQTLIAARERRVDYGASILELPNDAPIPMHVVQDDWIDMHGAHPVRWMHNGQAQTLHSTEAKARIKELQLHATNFRRLMQTRAPKSEESCNWECARSSMSQCRMFRCN